METKKNTEVNIEKLRVPITMLGLLFTGSIILASFSFTTSTERDSGKMNDDNVAVINFLEVSAKPDEPTPPQQQPVVLPPDQNIKIDSNTQVVVIPVVVLPPPPLPPVGPPPPPPIPEPIEFPDVDAKFNGELQRWIADNVQYPQTAIEMNEQGMVYLSFVVELDGSITNINVERGVSPDLDREAKRLTRIMPNWIPAETDGKRVRARCRLPIKFRLD